MLCYVWPRSRRFLRLLCVVFACLALRPAGAQTPAYTITDLGALPGFAFTSAQSVNAGGRVAGYVFNQSSDPHAFVSNGNLLVDLGVLPGFTRSFAQAISDNGIVCGGTDPFSETGHALLYQNGTLTDLGTLGGAFSRANSVNDSGQTCGTAERADGLEHAFLYEGGAMRDLGTLRSGGDGNSFGNALNAAGQVTGYADGPFATHAFLYEGGVMTDLGTLGGVFSAGDAINASGQVTGSSDRADGSGHAFLWSGGAMRDLGTLGGGTTSEGAGINATGQVVGNAANAAHALRAFVWSGGVMSDLNDLVDQASGWTLTNATGINDNGQIVCIGQHEGLFRSCLLTPIPAPALISVVLTPASVPSGTLTTAMVTLDKIAPTGGLKVAVTAGAVSLGTITVAAGQKTGSLVIGGNVPGTYLISAKLGSITKSATLTVTAPALKSFTVSRASVPSGGQAVVTATLTGRAVAAVQVIVKSNGVTFGTIAIASGATGGTLTFTSGAPGPRTLSATLSGPTKTASLLVTAPVLSAFTLSPASIKVGAKTTLTATLTAKAATATAIRISTNGAYLVTLTVPAGATSATGPLTGSRPGTFPITAADPAGVTKTISLAVTP